jgi:hypothetical protein
MAVNIIPVFGFVGSLLSMSATGLLLFLMLTCLPIKNIFNFRLRSKLVAWLLFAGWPGFV